MYVYWIKQVPFTCLIDRFNKQYGNLGCQVSKKWDTKLDRLWAKNQQIQRKLLYFVNRYKNWASFQKIKLSKKCQYYEMCSQ